MSTYDAAVIKQKFEDGEHLIDAIISTLVPDADKSNKDARAIAFQISDDVITELNLVCPECGAKTLSEMEMCCSGGIEKVKCPMAD